MTTYLEAVQKILTHVRMMDAEEKPLFSSLGQVAAEDILAGVNLPLVDQAGPDGYAVRAADISHACHENPTTLKIIGSVRAGIVPRKSVVPGTAMRIMTGSIMPKGADCVVWFEDTDEPGNKSGPNLANPRLVRIHKTVNPGENVLKVGATVKKDDLLVAKGGIISTAQMAALLLTGCHTVRVIRRPVIAVIATGDELISSKGRLRPGRVINCNSPAVASLVVHYGGIPRLLGIARDNEASLMAKIRKGLDCDAIITSGGASRGDYDLIRCVIGRIGELIFARTNMGPGASMAFGMVRREQMGDSIPLFALAGPPEGCMINTETLVRPALFKMLGLQNTAHPVIEATTLDASVGKKGNAFVRWSKLTPSGQVTLGLKEKVGALAAVASANCLTIVPAGGEVPLGGTVQALPLDWNAGTAAIPLGK